MTIFDVFVSECCITRPDYYIAKDLVFQVWLKWCGETGHKAGTREQLGKQLMSVCPRLKTGRIRRNGKRIYTYRGITLQDWTFVDYLTPITL